MIKLFRLQKKEEAIMYRYSYITPHAYDKANQLVSSTTDGKVTHYAYDAAGRMIQAGDKSYIYNGQNKVVEVRQNGKTIARFEYNIDGQIAKAIYGNKVEEFMWDGLALIWRSGVTYINEPYVTGGNPVMAGDDVLFNDMLGNTLAVNGNSVEMTSFGETADKNAFFTGKPMIDELGYSFLFRDYNPNQGKWTTTDPLGYPDGWNNLAYCNNGVTVSIDWFGGVTISSFQNAIDFYAINTDSNFTATIADSIILETLSSWNYNNYYNQLVSNLGNVSTISNSGSLDAGGVVSWFQGLILGRTTTIITGEIKWVASDWIKDSNGGYSRNIVATGTIKLTINDRWDFEEHKNDSRIKNLLEEIGPGYIADTWASLVNGGRKGIPYNLSGFANHNISIVTTQKE